MALAAGFTARRAGRSPSLDDLEKTPEGAARAGRAVEVRRKDLIKKEKQNLEGGGGGGGAADSPLHNPSNRIECVCVTQRARESVRVYVMRAGVVRVRGV